MKRWQSTSLYLQNAASKQSKWKSRAPIQAELILKSGASFILFQELYAAERPLMEKLLASKYELSMAYYGRVLFHYRGRWRPISDPWTTRLSPAGKPAIGMKFQRNNGARVNIVNAHLSYETTKAGDAKRLKETKSLLLEAMMEFQDDEIVFGGDFNSPAGATTRPDVVGDQMKLAQFVDIGLKAKAPTGRGNYHIDRAFGRDAAVKPIEVKILNHRASDHNGVFIKFKYRRS